MDTNTDVIDYMKKITVSLETGTSPDSMDLCHNLFIPVHLRRGRRGCLSV